MLAPFTCIWTPDPNPKARHYPCSCPGQNLALASAAPCILLSSSRLPNCVDSYRQRMAPLVVAWVIAAPNLSGYSCRMYVVPIASTFTSVMPSQLILQPARRLGSPWYPGVACTLPWVLFAGSEIHPSRLWPDRKSLVSWWGIRKVLTWMNGFGWGEWMRRKSKGKGTMIAKIWRLENNNGKLPWLRQEAIGLCEPWEEEEKDHLLRRAPGD